MPTAEAARYVGLAESTLRYYRHAGIGPVSYRLSGKVFYDRLDLDDWIAAERAASVRGGVQ
jgi:DNA-binding transcriptional MerR regulator